MTTAETTVVHTYHPIAKLLHWAIAVLLLLQFIIGWTMPHIGRGTLPVGKIGWHVAVGVALILLVAARVIWRIARPPVASGIDRSWINRLAQATHVLLYLLMVVVPVLGWANANARGWTVAMWGWLPLPKIMPDGSALGHDMGDVHGTLALVLAILAGLHIAAGLYHQFVRHDGVLRSMT